MSHSLFNWIISSAVLAPFIIGVPLLMLVALLDDFTLRTRRSKHEPAPL